MGTPTERYIFVWIVCDDQGGDHYMVRDVSVKQNYAGGKYDSDVSYKGVGLRSFYVKKSDAAAATSTGTKKTTSKKSKKRK